MGRDFRRVTRPGSATKEVGCGGPGGTFQNARWEVEGQRPPEPRCATLLFPLSGTGPLTGESRASLGRDTRPGRQTSGRAAAGGGWPRVGGGCGFPEPDSVFGRRPGCPAPCTHATRRPEARASPAPASYASRCAPLSPSRPRRVGSAAHARTEIGVRGCGRSRAEAAAGASPGSPPSLC